MYSNLYKNKNIKIYLLILIFCLLLCTLILCTLICYYNYCIIKLPNQIFENKINKTHKLY